LVQAFFTLEAEAEVVLRLIVAAMEAAAQVRLLAAVLVLQGQ
jgi:hypothetical protein